MRNLILIFLLLPSLAWAEDSILPNHDKTPGSFYVDATVAKICERGYSSSMRNVTDEQKEQVFKEYGLERSGEYEVDHLISLQLGGTNNNDNLWPQSYHGYWNAKIKDILENKLHTLVCDDKISLREAQLLISENWIEAYCKVIPSANCKGSQ